MTSRTLSNQNVAKKPMRLEAESDTRRGEKNPAFLDRALSEGMKFEASSEGEHHTFDLDGAPLPGNPQRDASEDRAATESAHGKTPTIEIDWSAQQWTDCDDNGGRLLISIVLGGIWFHVEAVEVQDSFEDGIQEGVTTLGETQLGILFELDGCDGGYQQTEINGRQYVLFLTPHSR